jgi:hypothetical protein
MDLNQTARMRRLVWIHAGKPIMLVLSWRGSFKDNITKKSLVKKHYEPATFLILPFWTTLRKYVLLFSICVLMVIENTKTFIHIYPVYTSLSFGKDLHNKPVQYQNAIAVDVTKEQ